jgi:hypothetical protein
MIVEFYGLRLALPEGWSDITDDLPEGSPPTLAKPDGVGVIQFSISRYRGGENPRISTANLKGLLEDFCLRNSLNCQSIREQPGDIMSAAIVSENDESLIAVWYLSNGMDVVLATYNGSQLKRFKAERELMEARTVIESVRF